MNKHTIIFSVLLTSAISLHGLSYNLTDPAEMVYYQFTPLSKNQVNTEKQAAADNKIAAINPDTKNGNIKKEQTTEIKTTSVLSDSTDMTVNVTPAQPKNEVKEQKPEVRSEPVIVAEVKPEPAKAAEIKTIPVTVPQVKNKPLKTTEVKVSETVPAVQKPVQNVIPENSQSRMNNDQSGAALIPTKNFKDIVREAKSNGGRLDPFLSMKPPAVEKVPDEIPVAANPVIKDPPLIASKPEYRAPEPVETFTYEKPKPIFRHKRVARQYVKPEIRLTRNTVPHLKHIKPLPQVAVVRHLPRVATLKTQPKLHIAAAVKTKQNIHIASVPHTIIKHEEEPKIQAGLKLTGIITGNKPQAFITVDNKRRVLGLGDVIRKDKNLRVVSIDLDNKAITVVDSKNRRAKIAIE